MVRKLFKHEFLAWLRIMPIVYIIFLCIAAMGRIIQMFETDSVAYNILLFSSIAVYIIGIIACFAFPVVFGVTRFYKNLYSGEGYLSFTLPVTPANHIWVKLLTATCFDIISFFVVVLSAIIITSGDMLTEVIKAISYISGQIPDYIAAELPFFIFEIILMLLINSLYQYLLFYACISVGQLFNKNRVLAAVGVYFAYYMVSQVISTILGMALSIISFNTTANMESTVMPTYEEIFGSFHVIMFIGFAVSFIITALLFVVNHQIMKKRLNLE